MYKLIHEEIKPHINLSGKEESDRKDVELIFCYKDNKKFHISLRYVHTDILNDEETKNIVYNNSAEDFLNHNL